MGIIKRFSNKRKQGEAQRTEADRRGGAKLRVLFVCMGNICRSPTAEGVFQQLAQTEGIATVLQIDSAGTHEYHIGSPPDQRSQAAALKRGYDLSAQRARKVQSEDFERFDLILAMDLRVLAALQEQCPEMMRGKLGLMMDYSTRYIEREVPDPYYGGVKGFEEVLDRIEDAARGLLAQVKRQVGDQNFLP